MVQQSRKDFIALWSVYSYAFLFLLFVSASAVPLALFQLGVFIPRHSHTSPVVLYDTHAFDSLPLVAKSYVVYDVPSQTIIAARDPYTLRPLASITKLMTALTAVHIAPGTTTITIDKRDIEGAFDLGLRQKQVWTLDNLLKYTLVLSSNDGAQSIASQLRGTEAFVQAMNEYAHELGFTMTFTQPAGLDIGNQLGGVGSAYDVARMMTFARRHIPALLDATTKARLSVPSSTGMVIGIPNTNQHVGTFSGIEASKTGFTNDAGGNLVLSVDITLGHPVIIVVLGSTRGDRFKDAEIIYATLVKSLLSGPVK